MNAEMMRQDLVSQFDFKVEKMYAYLDDCNLKFIDSAALKRFLKKCGVIANKSLLISIIRRFDMDADSRLGVDEFHEGIMPM